MWSGYTKTLPTMCRSSRTARRTARSCRGGLHQDCHRARQDPASRRPGGKVQPHYTGGAGAVCAGTWRQRVAAHAINPPCPDGESLRRAIWSGEASTEHETSLKNAVRFGGSREASLVEPSGQPNVASGFQGDLGIVVVSCARGDVRQAPNGLWVYDDDGQREVPVQGLHDERMAELDEMYQALTTGRSVRHDGRWGMATLEVVLAMLQSTQEHREIMLSHQGDAY